MISIVMPVYNTGKYLEESIQSILMQSYSDFELICVDDCSSDKLTKEILCDFVKKDSRIKVLSMKHNVGAAEARNVGLVNSKGEYITFLDADDIFHKDLLLNAYNTAAKYDLDMCIWGYRVFSMNEDKKTTMLEVASEKLEEKIEETFKLVDLSESGLVLLQMAPWTKLCKKSFLIDNNIKFQTLKCCNDVYYSVMCAISARKIAYVEGEQILVEYRTESGNQISSNRDPRCVCDAIEAVLANCKLNMQLNTQIAYAYLHMMMNEFRSSKNELWREESYYRLRNSMNKSFLNVNFDDNTYNIIRKKINEEDYDYGKFFVSRDLSGQLKSMIEELKLNIGTTKELVIWGNGGRGHAFLSIIESFDCNKVIMVDSKNNDVGGFVGRDIPIVHTDEVKRKNCTIVATNTKIFNYIRSIDDYNDIKVVNLEIYCPVG